MSRRRSFFRVAMIAAAFTGVAIVSQGADKGGGSKDSSNSKKGSSSKDSSSKGSSSKNAPKLKEPEFSKGTPEVAAMMEPGKTFTLKTGGEMDGSYSVYVPTSFNAEKPSPILIAFSPGGDGMSMLRALKDGAEQMGWTLVGCNGLRNKMEEAISEKMETEILDDIFKKLPQQTTRRYLAGFSGGGQRCFTATQKGRHPQSFTGIISMGGWMGGVQEYEKKREKDIAVVFLNGDNDENANFWVGNDTKQLKKYDSESIHMTFPGKHQTPPPDAVLKAMKWLDENWSKKSKKK